MGGGKGQSKQSIPPWAQNVGMALLGGQGFQGNKSTGGLFGDTYPTSYPGPAGDIVGGFQGASPQQLFGGLGNLPGMAAQMGPQYAQLGQLFSGMAGANDAQLAGGGMVGAGQSNALNQLMPGFLSQAQNSYGNLNSLLGMDPSKIKGEERR